MANECDERADGRGGVKSSDGESGGEWVVDGARAAAAASSNTPGATAVGGDCSVLIAAK